MWSAFKAMPVLPKVLIVCLVLGVIYKATNQSGPTSEDRRGGYSVPASGREYGQRQTSAPDAARRALAQFQAQQSQLLAQVSRCEAQMNQATQQMAMAAANGMMVNNRPACEQYMPQWTAQEAYLETEIYRLKTGDTRTSLRDITGIPAGSTASSRSGYGSPSRDGTGAVDNWDRQAIRGNSLYTDENGRQQELPTRNYYFRDRSSGQIIGSDQPYPPNDGRDYEQFQNGGPQ